MLVTHFFLVVIYLYNSLFLSFVLSERNIIQFFFLSFFFLTFCLYLSTLSVCLPVFIYFFILFVLLPAVLGSLSFTV